jgi:general secretion pathway protein A
MYAAYFGLKHEPFSIAPDPRYLFMSERHREALAHLVYGVGGGGGFVLLSGEIGTGKTTVCRLFLEQIPANCNVAYIFNPKLTVDRTAAVRLR